MVGPTPTSPQSLLNVIGVCDNFRVSPLPQEFSGFRTENLVTWRLSSEPSSPAIGLLRSVIVQQLCAENASAPSDKAPWIFFDDGGREAISFADWIDTPTKRTQVMLEMCKRWMDEGLFSEVIGPKKWRNEMYPIYRKPFGKRDAPRVEELEASGDDDTTNFAFMMERAACALFGTATYGVHMTIYVHDGEGCKIWIPTRSHTKPTWPGYLDNTVAGGVPSGYGVFEALVKESMEEASIDESLVRNHAKAVGSISYFYSTDAGWLQPEVEYLYDLRVPEGVDFRPLPSDGEVESFELLPLDEVIVRMRMCLFKANCAVALLDFLVRHGYVAPDNEPDFQEIVTRLHGRFDYERW